MKRLVLLTLVVAWVGIAPAWAHEEITPSTFPVGKPVFLSLTAANEKQVRLTKLTLGAPQGLAFGETTRSPAGWTSSRTDTAVTWTGGFIDPDRFDSFGFEIEGADQPGPLDYKATLSYADGTNDDVTVQVAAVAAGSSASTSSSSGSSGSGRADAALAVGVVALLCAAAALVRSGRGARPESGATAAGGEQDW
jgi:uncharacterized protein YcnI